MEQNNRLEVIAMTIRNLCGKALFGWLVACFVYSAAAFAAYPEKPVTIVVPYPAGGATDVIARMLAEKLAGVWKQQVVVTNKPGAGTTVAAEALARAPGDGSTL